MAIEEIPIATGEPPEPEEAEAQEVPEETEEPPPAPPAPKRRGRPAGAKNRPKPKVAAPPPVIKRQRSRRPPTPESTSSEEEEPAPRGRAQSRRDLPEDPMRQMAAEMLHLMQAQTLNRQQARANKYASWFPQQSYA